MARASRRHSLLPRRLPRCLLAPPQQSRSACAAYVQPSVTSFLSFAARRAGGLCICLALHVPLARSLWAKGNFLPAYLFMMALSVLIVSATTSLALGEYPGNRHFRRRIFLAVKIALVLPIACCG